MNNDGGHESKNPEPQEPHDELTPELADIKRWVEHAQHYRRPRQTESQPTRETHAQRMGPERRHLTPIKIERR